MPFTECRRPGSPHGWIMSSSLHQDHSQGVARNRAAITFLIVWMLLNLSAGSFCIFVGSNIRMIESVVSCSGLRFEGTMIASRVPSGLDWGSTGAGVEGSVMSSGSKSEIA